MSVHVSPKDINIPSTEPVKVEPVTEKDFEKIMELMKERIDFNLLKKILPYKLFIYFMMFYSFILPILFVFFIKSHYFGGDFLSNLENNDVFKLTVLSAIVLQLIPLSANLFFYKPALTYEEFFDIKKLVSTASQYREFASQSLGRKVEFDLRLTEAEELLYRAEHPIQSLFRRTPYDKWRRKKHAYD